MAKIAATVDLSIPASEAIRAGWALFWTGVWARLRRRPWRTASVQMRFESDDKK